MWASFSIPTYCGVAAKRHSGPIAEVRPCGTVGVTRCTQFPSKRSRGFSLVSVPTRSALPQVVLIVFKQGTKLQHYPCQRGDIERNLCEYKTSDHSRGFFNLLGNADYRCAVLSECVLSRPGQYLSDFEMPTLEGQRVYELGSVLDRLLYLGLRCFFPSSLTFFEKRSIQLVVKNHALPAGRVVRRSSDLQRRFRGTGANHRTMNF